MQVRLFVKDICAARTYEDYLQVRPSGLSLLSVTLILHTEIFADVYFMP